MTASDTPNKNVDENDSILLCTSSPRDPILELAALCDGQVRDFEDGHIPENFVQYNDTTTATWRTTTTPTCNPDTTTKLVEYPSFTQDRVPAVHVIDQALPLELVNALYDLTVAADKPAWGTYVTMEQVAQAYQQNDKPMLNKDRDTLAAAAASHFFQSAVTVSSPRDCTTKEASKIQTYIPEVITGSAGDTDPKKFPFWTLNDSATKAHGVAIWALASSETNQVSYHLDYAEQIRYEHNIIVPPILAGTLHCTQAELEGGAFMCCLDGLSHYQRYGYKGVKQSQDLPDPQSDWVTIPYKYNRMILASGHLPHLSTPIQSITLPKNSNSNDDTSTPLKKRVILGFNVFGRDYGPMVQQAPEHSDIFRRKVKMQRLLLRQSQGSSKNGSAGNTNAQQSVSLATISNNKGLSKLLVLAKREKVKQELILAQQKLDQALEQKLLSTPGNDGISVQALMEEFGNADGSTWPSKTDVLVHLDHWISSSTAAGSKRDTGTRRKLQLVFPAEYSTENHRQMIVPSAKVRLLKE